MDFPNKRNENFLETIKKHRSIRKFVNKKIPEDDIMKIFSATQSTSSSSHGQSYSIINITDPNKREKLSQYSGNQHVKECSHFFVFCGDLYRIEQIGKQSNTDLNVSLNSTEMFLVATIDAAIAAQTTAVAAEALGYGIGYIGGIRNNIEKVSNILHLPNRTYPLFGMCIGVPDEKEIPDVKPRLPIKAIMFENKYPDFEETYEFIRDYDKVMESYYMSRTGKKRIGVSWTDVMIDKRRKPRRLNIKSFLKEKGFPLN